MFTPRNYQEGEPNSNYIIQIAQGIADGASEIHNLDKSCVGISIPIADVSILAIFLDRLITQQPDLQEQLQSTSDKFHSSAEYWHEEKEAQVNITGGDMMSIIHACLGVANLSKKTREYYGYEREDSNPIHAAFWKTLCSFRVAMENSGKLTKDK